METTSDDVPLSPLDPDYKAKLYLQLKNKGADAATIAKYFSLAGVDKQIKDAKTAYFTGAFQDALRGQAPDFETAGNALVGLIEENPQAAATLMSYYPQAKEVWNAGIAQQKLGNVTKSKAEAQKAQQEFTLKRDETNYNRDLQKINYGKGLDLQLQNIKDQNALQRAIRVEEAKADIAVGKYGALVKQKYDFAKSLNYSDEDAAKYALGDKSKDSSAKEPKLTAKQTETANSFGNMFSDAKFLVENRSAEESGEAVNNFYEKAEAAIANGEVDAETANLLRNQEYFLQYVREYNAGNYNTAKEMYDTMSPEFKAQYGIQ